MDTIPLERVNKGGQGFTIVHRDPAGSWGLSMSSIYDAIGGSAAVAAAVDLFYDKVLDDPALAPWFVDTDLDRLRTHQRAFLAAALGGPEAYDGRTMAEAHRGMSITDTAFDRVATHLSTTLSDLGIDDATVAAIVGQVAGLRGDVVEASAARGR